MVPHAAPAAVAEVAAVRVIKVVAVSVDAAVAVAVNAADAVKGTVKANEYFAAVHSQAGSDIAADAGRAPCRRGCVPAIAGFGTSSSRLPDDSGGDVLSRRKPGCHVVIGNGSART